MRSLFVSTLLALTFSSSRAQTTNGVVAVHPISQGGAFTGFRLISRGMTVVDAALNGQGLIAASSCVKTRDSLTFRGLRSSAGAQFSPDSWVRVELRPDEPYPQVSFDLTLTAFDPAAWQKKSQDSPFSFLSLELRKAAMWHTRGWLNATPLADPFPLLLDKHAGTPEISAYTFNRRWSNLVPLGAQPLPVIGLWAPSQRRYVGMEFQTTRLGDNSEREIATGYFWGGPPNGSNGAPAPQFATLVYPYGGQAYQRLVYPAAGAHIASHGNLIWSSDLPATDDPNRLLYAYLWQHERQRLPQAPEAADLSWLPGADRLSNFPGAPEGNLVHGPEKPFQSDDATLVDGWPWEYENPALTAMANNDANRLSELDAEARKLIPLAKHFEADGDTCVYWDKPLTGQWVDDWGGKPVTTLHNANGFAAGRLFLGLGIALSRPEYLKIAEGVYHWAKHVAWTRCEFADVPSSPFAIGGTLPISFCLEFRATLANSDNPVWRYEAKEALQLARSFTYRYLTMWPSDNDHFDGLDSSFLWEPNSGRDWTGAACANEVFWDLDTLGQTAVATGDPVLMWALQGSLSRFNLLYQDKYAASLGAYGAADMDEGYGLFEGNVYGYGHRSSYGFSAPLEMLEPVGSSTVRVLAGEGGAMAFDKGGSLGMVHDYRFASPANFQFTVTAAQPSFDLSLTEPYASLTGPQIGLVRQGKSYSLPPDRVSRNPNAPWSLLIRGVQSGDELVVGAGAAGKPALPSTSPQTGDPVPSQVVRLPFDTTPDVDWSHKDSWAALPRGAIWRYGMPFMIAPAGSPCAITKQAAVSVRPATFVALAYSDGDGPPPSLILSDGTRLGPRDGKELMAWRAWPPIFTQRLLASRYDTAGKTVAGIDPGSRLVWAMSLSGAPSQEVDAAWSRGHADWLTLQDQERAVASLRSSVSGSPQGRIAILGPSFTGPIAKLAGQTGLDSKAADLSGARLVDGRFTVERYPVALYAGGEEYVDTVARPDDGAVAVRDYLRSGGTLVLAASGPFPMYYANGPGRHQADPLPPKLGLPITIPFDTLPDDDLQVVMQGTVPGLDLSAVPMRFPMPSNDPRLRSIDPAKLPPGANYTPIARVIGKSGQSYGDAAGLLELPNGAKILYVWCGLTSDDKVGPLFSTALFKYVLQAANR